MAKIEKTEVRGVALGVKEKAIYDVIVANERAMGAAEIYAIEGVEAICPSVRSVVATLAYLDTKQNLIAKTLEIVDNKPVTKYAISE